jgi:hypothetical protein
VQDLFSEPVSAPARQQPVLLNNAAVALHPHSSMLAGPAYGPAPSALPLAPGFSPGVIAFPMPGMPAGYPQYLVASPGIGLPAGTVPRAAGAAEVPGNPDAIFRGPAGEQDVFSNLVPGLRSTLPAVQPAAYKAHQPPSNSALHALSHDTVRLQPAAHNVASASTGSLQSSSQHLTPIVGNGTFGNLQGDVPYYFAPRSSGSGMPDAQPMQPKRAGGNPFA